MVKRWAVHNWRRRWYPLRKMDLNVSLRSLLAAGAYTYQECVQKRGFSASCEKKRRRRARR